MHPLRQVNLIKCTLAGVAVPALLALSACTSVAYRCPLDLNEKADSPTACANMQDALVGATRGSGSANSVLTDGQGRRIPAGYSNNKPANPLPSELPGQAEPYKNASGDPVFDPPRVFQAWLPAFVDADGNLHDGHSSWFSTPGRWSYGSLQNSGLAGDLLMRPGVPGVPDWPPTANAIVPKPAPSTAAAAAKAGTTSALGSVSHIATGLAQNAGVVAANKASAGFSP